MYIAMVSAECAPIAKAGGLGDFMQGLSHELAKRGEQVEIILPYYDVANLDAFHDLYEIHRNLSVPHHDHRIGCRLLGAENKGIGYRFIDPHADCDYFRRGRVYGEADDAERFAFFSRAVLEYLLQSGRPPDILHCQDWQTGLIPVLWSEVHRHLGLGEMRLCYTLHNLGYQGRVEEGILHQVGLDPSRLMHPDRLLDHADDRMANLMKGGIVFSHFVNTVSPRYAWEVQNTDQGMGLQPLFQAYSHKFGGVLNGIDEDVWSPERDSLIPVNFGPNNLPLKAANRRALRSRMGLAEVDKPIFAVVSRLDRQKGVDLIRHAIHYLHAEDCQLVLLGSALDPAIDAEFQRIKQDMSDSQDCRLELGYDESLAHLIYAGSDMLIVPSLYEPCGLTQMIAMKYGVVPIVRRVGGLADTVQDANYSDKPFESRTGYVFDDATDEGLESALHRAIGLWRRFPEYFRQLRVNGMRADFSWSQPADRYLEIYEHLQVRG